VAWRLIKHRDKFSLILTQAVHRTSINTQILVIHTVKSMNIEIGLYLTLTATTKFSSRTCYLDERCVPHLCHV
jgi:hypothetical protein